MTATVLRAGFVTTVQDLGRTGYRESGVSVGGALDTHALRITNLLVGNEPGAAGIEATLGGVRLRFADERSIAWAGGEFQVEVAGTLITRGRPARIGAGEELSLIAPECGGRAWLAISGGIDVPLVLGSRSTDLRNGFGGHEGRPLVDGDLLPLGAQSPRAMHLPSRVANFSAPTEWVALGTPSPFLRIVRGAHWEQFNAAALLRSSFTVDAQSDRMGARFSGPELERALHRELVSEAVSPGTIQIPPNGQPILLLGDCQTIGGYPKIAHVITVDLSLAAQLCAGDAVRFLEVSLEGAQRLWAERERDVRWFRAGLELHIR